ncbi:MAG: rhodanese-like domain-containing protein [Phycisphaerales bacterium]
MIVRGPAAVVLACACCLFASCGRTSDRDVELMSVAQARRLWSTQQGKQAPATLFLDARSAEEFAEGHIPGAKNLTLANATGELAPSVVRSADKVVVYGPDPASPAAMGLAKRLMSQGVGDVYLMQGGLLRWRTNGGELEKAGPAR